MASNSLSDARLRGLKTKDRPYKIGDRDGLYVHVSTTGTRSFRYNFKYRGRSQTITYGRYPVLTLERARTAHQEALSAIQAGRNPIELKKAERAQAAKDDQNTFSAVAQRWYEFKRAPLKAERTLAKDRIFLRDTAAAFGGVPIHEVTNKMVLDLLRSKLKEGQRNWPDRLRQKMSSVFRFAQSEGIDCRNVAEAVKEGIALNFPEKNHPFIRDHRRMGQLLRDCDVYEGSFRVRVALCLLPHVFVRPGELRFAVWEEFDLEQGLWTIPGPRMKMNKTHMVPLSPQSVALIRQLEPLKHESRYLFQGSGPIEKPISENTLNGALRTMGYRGDEMVAHGFRGFASTNLNELGFEWYHIEKQLAHKVGSEISVAYNKAGYLDQRTKMMLSWSNFLDGLKAGT